MRQTASGRGQRRREMLNGECRMLNQMLNRGRRERELPPRPSTSHSSDLHPLIIPIMTCRCLAGRRCLIQPTFNILHSTFCIPLTSPHTARRPPPSLLQLPQRKSRHPDRHVPPFARRRTPPAAGLDLGLPRIRHRLFLRHLCARRGDVDLDAPLSIELRDVQRVGVDDDVVVDSGGVDGEFPVGLLLDAPGHGVMVSDVPASNSNDQPGCYLRSAYLTPTLSARGWPMVMTGAALASTRLWKTFSMASVTSRLRATPRDAKTSATKALRSGSSLRSSSN